jgi:hypothetical protein
MLQPSFKATGAPQALGSSAAAGSEHASSASNSMRDFAIEA